jgi:8-oxo-dGTP pyrophosphatase MutT (NUDIX family)
MSSPSGADQSGAVCGIVLLRSDGAALLQLRDTKSNISDPGIWVFPGGHVESGESLEAGARREFLEETCYHCDNLQELARFSADQIGYDGNFTIAFFWGRYDGRQGVRCLEGQELRFVDRRDAVALPKRKYLLMLWDRALAASGIALSEQTTDL